MSKLIVILDPAHGAEVPGKRSPDGTHREYQWSRQICNALFDKLQAAGIEVVQTNGGNTEIGLSKRAKFATAYPKDTGQTKLLVSIHNNAAGSGATWLKARGWSVYTSKGVTYSDKLAEVVIETLTKDFPELTKRYYAPGENNKDFEENFTVLMGSGYAAMLIEWLFQDNQEDLEVIKDETTNARLVNSLLNALKSINATL